MGLLYIMPKSEKEVTHVKEFGGKTTIETYGLPYIFWVYFAILIIVLLAMTLPAIPILKKLLESNNLIDKSMGIITMLTLIGLPLSGLLLLFYQKQISMSENSDLIEIKNKILYITYSSKTFQVKKLSVSHYLTSPNMAKINNEFKTRAFENRGHFVLQAETLSGDLINLDRHTNRSDLEGLKKIIEKRSKILS